MFRHITGSIRQYHRSQATAPRFIRVSDLTYPASDISAPCHHTCETAPFQRQHSIRPIRHLPGITKQQHYMQASVTKRHQGIPELRTRTGIQPDKRIVNHKYIRSCKQSIDNKEFPQLSARQVIDFFAFDIIERELSAHLPPQSTLHRRAEYLSHRRDIIILARLQTLVISQHIHTCK